MWLQSKSSSVNVGSQALPQSRDQFLADVRRRCLPRPHQRRHRPGRRQHDVAGQLAPVRHHRRQADAPAVPSARQLDQVLVDLGVEQRGVHVRPGAGSLLQARLVGVRIVGRGQHRIGDVAHPSAVQPDRRVEQQQRGDPVRGAPWPGASPARRRRSGRPPAPARRTFRPAARTTPRRWRRWSTGPPRTTCRGRADPVRRPRSRAGSRPAAPSADRGRSDRGVRRSAPALAGRSGGRADRRPPDQRSSFQSSSDGTMKAWSITSASLASRSPAVR